MKNFSLSALPLLLLVWSIAVCFNGTVQAREIRGNDSSSSSTAGRSIADSNVPERSNFRRLQTPKAKAKDDLAAASDSAGAADDTAKAPPKKGSTDDQDKVSIADRTSDVPTKKEAPNAEDLGIHFTKPETAPPSVAPPTMPKPGNSTAPASKQKSSGSNSTSSSSKSSGSDSTTTAPAPAPTRTGYPTAISVGSIASQTSTMDEATHVPNSAGMEFVTPETGAPNNNTYGRMESSGSSSSSSSSSSSTTSPSSNSGNTTESDDDGGYAAFPTPDASGTNDDEVLAVASAQGNKTYLSKPIDLPKEKDQPENWPEIVGGIFVLGAIFFFAGTCFKTYQRRKDYQEVPVSLTV